MARTDDTFGSGLWAARLAGSPRLGLGQAALISFTMASPRVPRNHENRRATRTGPRVGVGVRRFVYSWGSGHQQCSPAPNKPSAALSMSENDEFLLRS